MPSYTRSSGFTLIEITIVLILLGILSGVVAMKYIDLQSEAQRKACLHSRAVLTSNMRLAWAAKFTGATPTAAEVQNLFAAEKADVTCPTKGTYSLSITDETAGDFSIICSEHTEVVGTHSFGNADDMQAIIGILDENGRASNDSGAANEDGSGAQNILSALEQAGINIADMGATSWHYDKNSKHFYWTPVDISNIEVGTKIPVICYNGKSGNYTVWYSFIEKHSSVKDNYSEYNQLKVSSKGYAPSTSTTANGNQTYESALKHYQDAVAAQQK